MLNRVYDAIRAAPEAASRLRSVSFSQYGEDLALASALQPRSKGFYVDVGAYAPAHLSNTYRLYLRGWCGVTIEPNPDAAGAFRALRPRDRHCVVGVAEEDATLTYRRFAHSTLNTFDAAQAAVWAARGVRLLSEEPVACRPLGAILTDVAPNAEIDLLCVDCEGFDLAVLRSNDWERFRPAAILIEDYERFETLAAGGAGSGISEFLIARNYAAISQTVFSFLWADAEVLAGRRVCAFDMGRSQVRRSG